MNQITAPEHEFTTLGEVVGRTGGAIQTGPFGSQLHASDYTVTGTPLIMPVNLGDNEIREAGIARVGSKDARRLRRHALREGDVIFSRRGDVGRRSLVRAEQSGWLCGTGCLAARFGSDRSAVNTAYVAQYLGSKPAQAWLQDNAVGGTLPNLNTSILAALPIRLPSRAEQDAIVTALEDAQVTVVGIERLIAKKQAIKQGMMQQLLTGRTRLPGFGGAWQNISFEELAVPAKDRVDPRKTDRHMRLIELDNIESGSGRLVGAATAADAVSLKAVFRSGDVLFGKLRSYLRKYWLADSVGLCSTEIWVLRARGANRGAFVRYIVESDRFIEVASGGYGTHMPRADWSVIRKLAVPTPRPDEQDAIAVALQDADAEIDALHARLAKAHDIKSGMMQQLLTGRTRLPVEAAS